MSVAIHINDFLDAIGHSTIGPEAADKLVCEIDVELAGLITESGKSRKAKELLDRRVNDVPEEYYYVPTRQYRDPDYMGNQLRWSPIINEWPILRRRNNRVLGYWFPANLLLLCCAEPVFGTKVVFEKLLPTEHRNSEGGLAFARLLYAEDNKALSWASNGF